MRAAVNNRKETEAAEGEPEWVARGQRPEHFIRRPSSIRPLVASVSKNPVVSMASTAAGKMAPRASELGEDLEMACDESRRISMEIENLKSQLERKVKELGCCEEKKKLRVELALKPKEMERLRKQNDELQAKNQGLQNNIVEILENQIVAKKKHLLQLERLEIQLELQKMMELPNEWLQKGNIKLNKAGKEDKLFTDHSGGKKKDDYEKSKQLELEMKAVDAEIYNKMPNLSQMSACWKAMVWKSFQNNMELLDARKQLIEVFLEHMPSKNSGIGIKMMGQLAEDTFVAYAQRNYLGETAAENLLQVWQEEFLEDPSWHPFKTVMVDGVTKEIIDRDDSTIQSLLNNLGNDAYKAVTVALDELREYNPSGRWPVPELWNFDQRRKATLREALNIWKKLPKKEL